MTINKLQALAEGTAGNSTGADVALAVNSLIDTTIVQVPSASGTPSYMLQDGAESTIDPAVGRCVMLSSTTLSQNNHIGNSGKIPNASDLSNAANWAVDTAYASGIANVASILGGYDNVVNQIAGHAVGANHSYIQYNLQGHSMVLGGTYGWISAGRSILLGATNCKIVGVDTRYGAIVGAVDSSITGGKYNTISGGLNNNITSPNDYHSIVGGYNNEISGASTASAAIGGHDNSIVNSRNVILGGHTNSITAYDAGILASINSTVSVNNGVSIAGANNIVDKTGSIAIGTDISTLFQGAVHRSAGKLATVGDCMSIDAHFKLQTTNATLTNMGSVNGALPNLGSGQVVATGTLLLAGVRTDTGRGASFKLDFMVEWDGTTAKVFDTVSGTNTKDLVTVFDNIGLTAQPHLAINTGAFRPKVTGLVGVTINWSASVSLTVVKG